MKGSLKKLQDSLIEPWVPLEFLGSISGEICGRLRERVSGGILGENSGEYLNYVKVNFLKKILKSLVEFLKEFLNYLAAKFH